MLDLRPNCECCDRDLPPETDAHICSFECTFCRHCAEAVLGGVCPNCGGELVRRPIRPPNELAHHPASTHRVRPSGGCRPPYGAATALPAFPPEDD
ncbi:MAG: DUF1272 domain-containing protein [Amaricoccus sp.]|uniref:DUF1272 domain-containing protein n=1 Tax=Amaricoccus sp. TaxID=1872485 RepID=UPI0039E55E5F